MTERRSLKVRIGVAAAAAALGALVAGGTGHAQSGEFPRASDGRPDLSGIWQAVSSAHWNIEPHAAYAGRTDVTGAIGAAPGGLGIVGGNGLIPYRPEAIAKRQENFENRRTEDPEAKCYLPGVPRATYMPFPFQIVQGTNKIFIAYEFASANRVIHMDPVPESPGSIPGWGIRSGAGTAIRSSSTSPRSTARPGSTGRATTTAPPCTSSSATRR